MRPHFVPWFKVIPREKPVETTETALDLYLALHDRYAALCAAGGCDLLEAMDLAGQLDLAWEQLTEADQEAMRQRFAQGTQVRAEVLDEETPAVPREVAVEAVAATEAEEAAKAVADVVD